MKLRLFVVKTSEWKFKAQPAFFFVKEDVYNSTTFDSYITKCTLCDLFWILKDKAIEILCFTSVWDSLFRYLKADLLTPHCVAVAVDFCAFCCSDDTLANFTNISIFFTFLLFHNLSCIFLLFELSKIMTNPPGRISFIYIMLNEGIFIRRCHSNRPLVNMWSRCRNLSITLAPLLTLLLHWSGLHIFNTHQPVCLINTCVNKWLHMWHIKSHSLMLPISPKLYVTESEKIPLRFNFTQWAHFCMWNSFLKLSDSTLLF